MPIQVSPLFTDSKLQPGCTLEDKIDVFEDQMSGWLLRHAHALLDEKYVSRKDAGFAVLTLVTAYFEPIESYHAGLSSDHKSKLFFRRGFLRVFFNLPTTLKNNGFMNAEQLAEDIADEIYNHLRCGLFHEGGAKHKLIVRQDTAPLGFMLDMTTGNVGSIVIDPGRFVVEVQNHLNTYVAQLRDASQTNLRQKFEAFFDNKMSPSQPTILPPPAAVS
jgi:hypothetical protein